LDGRKRDGLLTYDAPLLTSGARRASSSNLLSIIGMLEKTMDRQYSTILGHHLLQRKYFLEHITQKYVLKYVFYRIRKGHPLGVARTTLGDVSPFAFGLWARRWSPRRRSWSSRAASSSSEDGSAERGSSSQTSGPPFKGLGFT